MLQVKCCIERQSKDQKLIEEREFLSRSFVVQFLGAFWRIFSDGVTPTSTKMKAIDGITYSGGEKGVSSYYTYEFCPLLASCGSGNGDELIPNTSASYRPVYGTGMVTPGGYLYAVARDKLGIVIGTDSTGETTSDYKLGARIVSGSGFGKMDYLACGASSVIVSGGSCYFDLVRSFINNSGSTITVEELGIYANSFIQDRDRVYCILRDTETVSVSDGEFLKIRYRFSVTA